MAGCRIRDELIIACSNSRPSSSQFQRVSPLRSIIPTRETAKQIEDIASASTSRLNSE